MHLTRCVAEKGDKSPLIDLRNGKVVCKQKCVSFEKQSETLQGAWSNSGVRRVTNSETGTEIVRFRDVIDGLFAKNHSPLTEVPEEHKPVIAKLAHERCGMRAMKSRQGWNTHYE